MRAASDGVRRAMGCDGGERRPARARPARVATPRESCGFHRGTPLPERRRTRSATSALLSGAQPVLVAPHVDPERILRSRPETISVEAGKRWFAGHLRELGSSLTLVADGSSGADEFLARLLENDWRSVVKSIPRELRAEWNKVQQLVLGWWKESLDALRRAKRETPGAAMRAAAARVEAAECV